MQPENQPNVQPGVQPGTPSAQQPAAQPMQQPNPRSAAQPAQQPQKYHVHNSYIWLGTIRSLFAVIVVFGIAVISSGGSLLSDPDVMSAVSAGASAIGGASLGIIVAGWLMAGVILLVLIGVVLLIHVLAYKNLYFMLDANEFSLYSGIITKRRVHVPYDRVQSVDARASLLQRIFGIRTLYIDTAGGASNKAIIVPYLTKQQAEWLTNELYGRKRSAAAVPVQAPAQPAQGNVLDFGTQAWNEVGGVFAGQPVQQAAPTYEMGLSNKELFLAGISNNTSFVIMVLGFLGVVAQIVGMAFELFPSESDAVISAFAEQSANLMLSVGTVLSIATLIVVLAIIWLLSGVAHCISYGGFRARRVGDRIEVERGLLQHTRQSISIQRVQAVVVKQSTIRRLIGYCEVSLDKIDAQSGDDSNNNNNLNNSGVVVHPFCKLADVPAVLAGLVPEYAGTPMGKTPLPAVSTRRAITRRCILQGLGFWLAAAMAITQIVCNIVLAPESVGLGAEAADAAFALGIVNNVAIGVYILAVVIFVLEVVSAVLWARESGFSVNERFMKVVNGGLSREERSFLRNKIQFGYTKTNPFQRMSNVATIMARTAAGVGGTNVELKDVSSTDADAWLQWLRPRTQI